MDQLELVNAHAEYQFWVELKRRATTEEAPPDVIADINGMLNEAYIALDNAVKIHNRLL